MSGPAYTATRNACKLCTPLGACLALRGVAGTVPFLHGSQGCATYIRRYLISHFREPVDIAASSISEESTVFGGGRNLAAGLDNVTSQYRPELIGVATTCLTETIGEDTRMLLSEYSRKAPGAPVLVPVSTPSFRGTHADGFHAAVRAVVEHLAEDPPPLGDGGRSPERVNFFPGMFSPADLRYLKEIAGDFGLTALVLPDYSDTLDGPALEHYEKIPSGGTPLEDIRKTPQARASIEFGRTITRIPTAAALAEAKWGVPRHNLGWPVGVKETDKLFSLLEQLTGRATPEKHRLERGRLVDAYVDGHKYVFGKRAVVFGEEDLVVGIAALLAEVGIVPVLCASGAESGLLETALTAVGVEHAVVRHGADFMTIGALSRELGADFLIGNSKGYAAARELGVPLVRVGFPVHDRVGGQRILHIGYRGAQQLFDVIVNTLLERKQRESPTGYSYL
jgi:nitrogenase molybdenum-iron protein NifN